MTPEQEEQVRRALGAAARAEDGNRPGAPRIPDQVAGRLDDVLAELVAQRSPVEPTQADDQLAARRHRRWPQVLVAAAVVAVIAGAGGAVALRGSGSASDSSASGTAAGGSGAEDRAAAPSAPSTSGGQESASGSAAGSLDALAALPSLRSASLTQDVQRLVDGKAAVNGAIAPAPQSTGSPARRQAPCARPARAHGERLVAVRLDGRRATLVLGPVQEGTREARVYSCDDAAHPVAVTDVHTR